jgi:hypothetical protein
MPVYLDVQMTKWTAGEWLGLVWNMRPRVLLRKQGMFVLYAFECHLTLDARSVIHKMNSDPVVMPGEITL